MLETASGPNCNLFSKFPGTFLRILIFFSHLSHWRHAVSWPSSSAPCRGPRSTTEAESSLTCPALPSSPHFLPRNPRIEAPVHPPELFLPPPLASPHRSRLVLPRTNRSGLRAPPHPPRAPSPRNRAGVARSRLFRHRRLPHRSLFAEPNSPPSSPFGPPRPRPVPG